MKVLHTSDWHLGHVLYGYDRADEQRRMLDNIKDIVAAEHPDALLVCGDVFHTGQPSASVQRMLVDALADIHVAAPAMQIVVTAGNHDSASKLTIFQRPWRDLNVTITGTLTDNIIEIPDCGFVIAVPYFHPRQGAALPFVRLQEQVEAINTRSLPVVMMAHATVAGCDSAGHEHATDFATGGVDAVSLDDFGQGYDYLALGHIHRPQNLSPRARYCGTPLAVSFDEAYPHSVSIVDIAAHGAPPTITEIEICPATPLRTYPPAGFAAWDEVLKMFAEIPVDSPEYVRLNVNDAASVPVDAYDMLRRDIDEHGRACRLCQINHPRTTGLPEADDTETMDPDRLRTIDPLEIARRLAGDTFDDDLTEMFGQVCDAIAAEEAE